MGEVYRAHDVRLDRPVAIKVLRSTPDAEGLAALMREARAVAALNHPHISTIHEVHATDDLAFMVMELVEGQPLNVVIPRDGLPFETVVRYGAQIADAMAHAHARGIVHRDLKSANVMITREGRAKVMDFGLARPLSQDLLETMTHRLAIAGTLPYMPPEILRGESPDARSDIWSLGVLMYEATAGTLPFAGRTGFEVSAAILHEPYALLPARVPAGLHAVIDCCLSKDPRSRYSTASELQAALEAIAADLKVPPNAVAPPRRSRRPVTIRSLVVLPLGNVSNEAEEYFADGMTDALIASLARLPSLRVISRTSAMHYKEVRKPLPEIARELNVDLVLEGSVIRAGQRARIAVQLIDAKKDSHLWAQSYERDLVDVLMLQDEIASAVAHEIRIAVTAREQRRPVKARPVDPEAYELYLKGRHFAHRWTEASLQKSVQYLKQSIARDPGYAPAYAVLAESYAYMGTFGMLPPREVNPPARDAVTKALDLDAGLAEAQTVFALLLAIQDWDWHRAGEVFQRAVELNPNSVTAHYLFALYLLAMGRNDTAIEQMKRAQQLDPLSSNISSNLGWIYCWARRADQAVDQLRATLDLDPHFGTAHFWLGDALRQQDRHDEALESYRRAVSLFPGPEMSVGLGHAFARAGHYAEARAVLAELLETSKRRTVTPYGIALIYGALGDADQAFAWLERTCEERSWWVMWLNMDPRLSELRADPRFQAVVRYVGLAP
jgi:serine/threonine protein kinase/Tfp pilus assembly protein PilF